MVYQWPANMHAGHCLFCDMSYSSELAAAIAELESDAPGQFSWAGSSWPCIPSPVDDSQELDAGGYKLFADLSIAVRRALFPDGIGVPALKQTILYRPVTGGAERRYRIDKIITMGDDVLILRCNDAAKDA